MEIDYEREYLEQFVNLVRTAPSEKHFRKMIEPAERLLNTYFPGAFPGFKRKAVAAPKKALLNLADIVTWFLEDTELTHYLTDTLNLPTSEALEIEAKVTKNTKRRI